MSLADLFAKLLSLFTAKKEPESIPIVPAQASSAPAQEQPAEATAPVEHPAEGPVTLMFLTALEPACAARAADFVHPLNVAISLFRFDDDVLAAFLGQVLVESQGFAKLSENLNYTHPERLVAIFPHAFKDAAAAQSYVGQPIKIANHVYANELGNGNEASGNGWAFRGSGLIMITGRSAQSACALFFGKDVDSIGNWMRTPEGATLSAAWWFVKHGCAHPAEAAQYDVITRIVNGPAMLQASLRSALSQKALKLLKGE